MKTMPPPPPQHHQHQQQRIMLRSTFWNGQTRFHVNGHSITPGISSTDSTDRS